MGKCINIVPTIHSAFAILLHFYFVLLGYFIIYLYMNITAIYLLIIKQDSLVSRPTSNCTLWMRCVQILFELLFLLSDIFD